MSGGAMDGGGANDLAVQDVTGEVTGQASWMYIHGNGIESYGTHFPIAERRNDGIVLTSKPAPSQTTATHVNAVKRAEEAEGLKITSKDLKSEV